MKALSNIGTRPEPIKMAPIIQKFKVEGGCLCDSQAPANVVLAGRFLNYMILWLKL